VRDRRPFLWISIEERDDDPAILSWCVATALRPVCRVEQTGGESSGRSIGPTADDLAAAVRRASGSFVLVVDHAHLLRDPASAEILEAVVANLPAGSQALVLARGAPALPLARLRAEERVVELGAADLAMAPEEAEAQLQQMDLELSKRDMAQLGELTEGWPAALHLAGLSLQGEQFDRRSTINHLRRSPSVVDYLRSEFLAGLPRKLVSFLTRTSVLRSLSGPMCDAVLERTGSARVLEELVRRNVLLVPLDQHGERYRVHRLLRQVLRGDLDRVPDRAADLLRRASEWSEQQGEIEEALGYAEELGDPDLMAHLLTGHALQMERDGHVASLLPWFDWFEDRGVLDRYPSVAALGALLQMLLGRATTGLRWSEAAERTAGRLPASERAGVQALLSLLRAAQCRTGPAQMERDAERVLEEPSGRLRASGLLLQAVARRLQGGGEEVDPLLVEAFENAVDQRVHTAAVLALSERAGLALEQEDWLAADDLVHEAFEILERTGLGDLVTSALLYAVAARVAVHDGDLPHGRAHLARAHRLRSGATHAIPFLAVQVRLEMARAYMALTDSAGARTMLRELESLFALRRDLGVLRRQADDVHAQVGSMRATFVGGASLTTAELRLLPLLATHYSFREIADRLFVSRHTVKTQAISIYRKLRVTSRSEAVESAQVTGLLA
jgi:LuxR family maltose regulon positive regulatory protein